MTRDDLIHGRYYVSDQFALIFIAGPQGTGVVPSTGTIGSPRAFDICEILTIEDLTFRYARQEEENKLWLEYYTHKAKTLGFTTGNHTPGLVPAFTGGTIIDNPSYTMTLNAVNCGTAQRVLWVETDGNGVTMPIYYEEGDRWAYVDTSVINYAVDYLNHIYTPPESSTTDNNNDTMDLITVDSGDDPLLVMNGELSTQLLSKSLHKMLYKYKKDSKIANSLLKINKYGYQKDSIRNVTLKRDKSMTYCPEGKDTITEGHLWSSKNRQSGKYGKIIRKLIQQQVPKLKYDEKDIEVLVNLLKGEVADGEFTIVSGNSIAKWYDGSYYKEGCGTLNGSCMRNGSDSWFAIYCKNQKVVSMVCLIKDDLLLGRALLWEDKYMDRIYGSDSTIEMFKQYAKERGYYHKTFQSYDSHLEWTTPDGEEIQKSIKIELETNFDYYPYLDTFCFMGDGFLSNDDSAHSYDYILNCTEGTNGDEQDDDDQVYDEYNDEYYHVDDCRYIEGWGHVYYSSTTEDEVQGGYILEEESITLIDGRVTHNEHCDLIEVEGDEHDLIENTFECEYDGCVYSTYDSESTFIDELGITINTINTEDAYNDAGYIFTDDGWVLEEEVEDADEKKIDYIRPETKLERKNRLLATARAKYFDQPTVIPLRGIQRGEFELHYLSDYASDCARLGSTFEYYPDQDVILNSGRGVYIIYEKGVWSDILNMTKEQWLINKAIEIGYIPNVNTGSLREDLMGQQDRPINEWYYSQYSDSLYTARDGEGGKLIYRKGTWADKL